MQYIQVYGVYTILPATKGIIIPRMVFWMMLLFVLRLGKEEDAVVVALTDSVLIGNVIICCKIIPLMKYLVEEDAKKSKH